MQLVLASVSASTAPSGVCRHAANIARGMLASSSVSKVTMLTGPWQADYFRDAFDLRGDRLEIRRMPVCNSSLSRNLWYLRGLPSIARQCRADAVHLSFPTPLMRSSYAVPVVVSLHDLYPYDIPQNFGWHRAWLNRAVLRDCLRNADAVACVSEATRDRLHRLFPAFGRARTSVILNSVGLPDPGDAVLPKAIGKSPFVLCIAQHRANKNLQMLLRSFQIALERRVISLDTKLVVVGDEGPETLRISKVVSECGLQDSVLFLRSISDQLLSALYKACELVVAPSLLEGFGLPVAEATAAGCRVVCSDIPAFRAVGAENCVFFDPVDKSGESLVAAMGEALARPNSMVRPPRSFDPQQAAAMYLALYSKLMFRNRTDAAHISPANLPASGDL